MQKTAKVVGCQPALDQNGQQKTWTGQYGLMYFSIVSFDNGDSGEVGSKTAGPHAKFVVGQQATYEITPSNNPQYAAKIKYVNPNFQGGNNYSGGGGKGKSLDEMYVAYAKDVVVAFIAQGKVENASAAMQAINTLAPKFKQLASTMKGLPAQAPAQAPQPAPQRPAPQAPAPQPTPEQKTAEWAADMEAQGHGMQGLPGTDSPDMGDDLPF